jgi:hypothetical protein
MPFPRDMKAGRPVGRRACLIGDGANLQTRPCRSLHPIKPALPLGIARRIHDSRQLADLLDDDLQHPLVRSIPYSTKGAWCEQRPRLA